MLIRQMFNEGIAFTSTSAVFAIRLNLFDLKKLFQLWRPDTAEYRQNSGPLYERVQFCSMKQELSAQVAQRSSTMRSFPFTCLPIDMCFFVFFFNFYFSYNIAYSSQFVSKIESANDLYLNIRTVFFQVILFFRRAIVVTPV